MAESSRSKTSIPANLNDRYWEKRTFTSLAALAES
jgi:hypothetical protein